MRQDSDALCSRKERFVALQSHDCFVWKKDIVMLIELWLRNVFVVNIINV